jgi:hypothetical protein
MTNELATKEVARPSAQEGFRSAVTAQTIDKRDSSAVEPMEDAVKPALPASSSDSNRNQK